MSGWVGLQLAGPPPAAAWLSAILVGGLFLEGCAIWAEPDSESSPHPASTKTNKEAASTHPNHIIFCRATMIAPSLLVTVCVPYGNQRTTHRGTIPPSRPDTRSSMPSTHPDQGVSTGRFEPLSHMLSPRALDGSSATRAFKAALRSSGTSTVGVGRGIRRSLMVLSGACRGPQERHKVLPASRTYF